MVFKDSDVIQVEAVYCPEAIEAWYSMALIKNAKRIERSYLMLRAKQHLSSLGWVFWYAQKGLKRELRYTSPMGKCFYSLRTACKSCIEDDGGKGGKTGFLALQGNSALFDSVQPSPANVTTGSSRISAASNSGKPSSSTFDSNSTVSVSKKRKRGEEKLDDCVDADEMVVIKGERGKSLKKMRKLRDEKEKSSKTKRKRMEEEESDDMTENIIPDDKSKIKSGIGKSMKKLMDLRDPRRLSSASCNSNHNDLNDDICSVCQYGGELVPCHGCPSAFHNYCLGLTHLADEEFWLCPSCCCGICGAGESKVESFMICEQCQHKFHIGCLKRYLIVSDKHWFCSTKCEQVFSSLQNLVGKGIRVQGDNLVWTLMKPPDDDNDTDVKHNTNKTKLHRAVDIMHECFEPSIDPITGRDLVEDVIFGRKSEQKRMNFSAIYTAVLERKNKVISVATVRIFRDLAEIPLVATRIKYRKNGMCRVLMNELERQMVEIGVRRLLLPAVPNMFSYWTSRFGFSKMEDSERLKLLGYGFLNFQDTILCQKILMESPDSTKSSKYVL